MDIENFGFSIVGIDNKETIKNVSELNKILEVAGISFELEHYEGDDRVGYLGIKIDLDTFNKKMTRNAGRKVNYKKAMNYNVNPTLLEVSEWRKTMTHQEIIEKIGCPRATYFRRLKKLSELYGVCLEECNESEEVFKCTLF